MRKTMLQLAAAFAVVTATAAPALACGGGFASPCGYGAGYGHGYGLGYGYAQPDVRYALLPDSVVQYYHADHGPLFSGPGQYAPYPGYRETASYRWNGYAVPYDYDGGPYANPYNHYSWAQPAYRGPVVYSYRPKMRSSLRYGVSPQRSYAPRHGVVLPRGYVPRDAYAPRARAHRYGPRSDGYGAPKVIYGNGHVGPAKSARQDARRAPRAEHSEALDPPHRAR